MKQTATFCFWLLLLNGCTIIKPASYCLPPKSIHIGRTNLLKIKKFVAQQEQISEDTKKYNIIKEYCFVTRAVNNKNVGLVSVVRRNVSHRDTHYFINGARFITPLVFSNSMLPNGQDSIQSRLILEKALARHSKEIDDSLKFRIQQVFYFSRK